MPKKTTTDEVDETLREYFEVKRLQDDFREKEKLQKQAKLAFFAFIYLCAVFFTFSSYGFGFLSPVISGIASKPLAEIKLNNLESEIKKLKEENQEIHNMLSEISGSSTSSILIEQKLQKIQNDQNKLYESLLLNPEDVVTARLLTDKLSLQDEKITALNDSLKRVDDTLSKIMWSVIILPLLGILGLLFKDKLFGKNNYSEVD